MDWEGLNQLQMSIERLKSIVGRSDFCGRTTHADWEVVTKWLGHPMPRSYTDLLDCFGHGVWGQELILLHPLAATWQKLSPDNCVEEREGIDPGFRSEHLSGDIPDWKFIPVGLLPYRKKLLVEKHSGHVVVYDSDYCMFEETETGIGEFLFRSVSKQPAGVPSFWHDFIECNWRNGAQAFSITVEERADGLWAIDP